MTEYQPTQQWADVTAPPVTGAPTAPPSGGASADDPSMKDKASQAAQASQHAAADVAHTAAGKAQDVVGETKNQARNVVGEARDQLRGHAGDQHQNAVKNLRSLGEELQSMAQNGQQDGVASGLVRRAGDQAHSAASWLDSRNPEDLIDEVRNFARRRPGVFLAGALVAGVVAGRLTRGVVATHQDSSGSSGDTGSDGGSSNQQLADAETTVYSSNVGTPAAAYPQNVTGGVPGGMPGYDTGYESGYNPGYRTVQTGGGFGDPGVAP